MSGPFTSQVAASTPFEGTEDTDGNPVVPPFTSENVRDAIIEAVQIAIEQNRALLLSQYNGNANNGRYLEFFVGIDSEDAPIFAGTNGFNIFSLTMETTGNSSNATLGFFDLNVSDTIPLYSAPFGGNKRVVFNGNPLFTIPSNGEFAIRVTNGSVQKPHLQLVIG